MPHCDSRVLHAKGECRHCDEFPDWQAAREAWGINFTGKSEPGKLPCPSQERRPLETIERWPGNRPATPEDRWAGVGELTVEKSEELLREVKGRIDPPFVGVVDDRSKLDTTLLPNGQQRTYLVLSEAERAKGFVRPVRTRYRHVGRPAPKYSMRDLTQEEVAQWVHPEEPPGEQYVKVECPPRGDPFERRFWTRDDLAKVGKGCGTLTTMGLALSETYAREPGFYGATFCCGCGTHLPVGADGEFVWDDGSRVGT